MALDVRETYLRDCSVHIYFSRVLLDALSVPPLGQVFECWFGPCGAHVGFLGASWGALGHFECVFERIWVSLAPFGRFGVGFFVYLRWNFHLFFVICRLFVDIFCISSDRNNSSKTSKKPRKNNGFSMILPSGRFQQYRTKQQTEIKICEEIFVWM